MTSNSSKVVRLLHSADMHIESYGSANSMVLRPLIQLAAQQKVDLVLIAGDLFDHNRVDDEVVEFTLLELLQVVVPVIILPGNHDCLVWESVYWRTSFSNLGTNVQVIMNLEGETLSFPELDMAIWGKPISSYEGTIRPLSGIPVRSTERWQIAVAHGDYVGSRQYPNRSYQISDEEIAQSGRDYVAMGHWGRFCCVHDRAVKAYYAGARTVAIVKFTQNAGIQVEAHGLFL